MSFSSDAAASLLFLPRSVDTSLVWRSIAIARCFSSPGDTMATLLSVTVCVAFFLGVVVVVVVVVVVIVVVVVGVVIIIILVVVVAFCVVCGFVLWC